MSTAVALTAAKSLEDPRKMLDQAVSEMREDLVKMRQASAEVMSTQKMLESKYSQAQASAVSSLSLASMHASSSQCSSSLTTDILGDRENVPCCMSCIASIHASSDQPQTCCMLSTRLPPVYWNIKHQKCHATLRTNKLLD